MKRQTSLVSFGAPAAETGESEKLSEVTTKKESGFKFPGRSAKSIDVELKVERRRRRSAEKVDEEDIQAVNFRDCANVTQKREMSH